MTKYQFKVGDIVVFKGYTDSQGTILQPGTLVKIDSMDAEGTMGCLPVNNGEPIPGQEGDTCYPDEVVAIAEYNAEISVKDVQAKMVNRFDLAAAEDDAAAAAPNKPSKASKIKAIVTEKAAKKAAAAKVEAPSPVTWASKKITSKGKKAVAIDTALQIPISETRQVLEVVHSSSVMALLAEKDALEAAKELVRRSEETEYTLGGVLAHIQREGIHQRLGFDGKRGFEDYIEKELGVKYRKARYLINIYEYFTALGIDENRLGQIGWSKAKELLGIATKENFDELVEYAQKNTRDKLVEHIKSNYVQGAEGESDTKTKMTRITFVLFSDQATIVTHALDAAKKQTGTDDPSAALEYICGEWSLMADNQPMALEDMIFMVESKFKVKLAIRQTVVEGATAHGKQHAA